MLVMLCVALYYRSPGPCIPVPATTRWVRVRAYAKVEMVIIASRPSDVVSSQALSLWGSKPLRCLKLETDMSGGFYGSQVTTVREEWADVLKDLTMNLPSMTGAGQLIFDHQNIPRRLDSLLGWLHFLLPDLMEAQKGLKEIIMGYGSVAASAGLAFLDALKASGWSVKIGQTVGGGPCSQLKKGSWEVKVEMYGTTVVGKKDTVKALQTRQREEGLMNTPNWRETGDDR